MTRHLITLVLATGLLGCTSVTLESPLGDRLTIRTIGTGRVELAAEGITAQSSGANVLSFFNHAVDAARLYFTRGLALPPSVSTLPATPAEPAGNSEEIQP